MSPTAHDPETALKVLVSCSVALAVMIVDFIWIFRDEVKYVWPKLKSWHHPKGYVIARYLGLACQIFNLYWTVRMYIGVTTTVEICRLWFLFQAVSVQVLLLIAEWILMYRTYALFFKSKPIFGFLILLSVGQTAALIVSAILSFPTNKHTETCLIVRSSVGNVFFSATTLTTNALIFFMTFWRYLRLPKKCSEQGYIRVAFRDSAWAVAAISVMMLFMTLCSAQIIKPIMSGNITYYWFITILCVAIGHLVRDHQKIYLAEADRAENDTWKGSVQLTSMIEIGESVWSLDTEVQSSDVHTPSSGTLRTTLSIPISKASQLSPSSCNSDGARQWYGDHPFGDDIVQSRNSPQRSTAPTPTSESGESSLPSSSAASDESTSQAEGHSSADADESPSEQGQGGKSSPPLSHTIAAEESVPATDEPSSPSDPTDGDDALRSEGSDTTACEHEPSPSPRSSPCPSPPPRS